MRYNIDISDDILKWVVSSINPDNTNPDILDTLISWRNKTKVPTYNQILDISRATGIPLGYFFLKTPPKEDLSFVNYRTVKSIELENPSRELKTIMLDMELIQDWLHSQLISDGEDKNCYVNSLKDIEDVIEIATTIRKELNISENWYKTIKNSEEAFKFLRNAISNSGIAVMVNGIVRNNTSKPLSINEFRAFALIDEYAPLIFINSNDSINGRIFSLLHEYVHIGLGENSLYNDRCSCTFDVQATETICNKVAAEILVPQEDFIKKWEFAAEAEQDPMNIIRKLTKYFICGMTVIARKALDNNFISHEKYHYIAQSAVANYKKAKSRGGDFYRTLNSKIDSNFLNYLFSRVDQGKTLYTEAYRLTNTNRETFNKLKSQFEGGLL